jgi:hypothetical protein
MAQRNRADHQRRATEAKFYLPGGVTPPFDASRLERLWATLFSHGVEPPK